MLAAVQSDLFWSKVRRGVIKTSPGVGATLKGERKITLHKMGWFEFLRGA